MSAVLVRTPAVAGLFYPSDPGELAESLNACFADASGRRRAHRRRKALVVPHAGYIYSGPVAASGYLRLAPVSATVRRVVLLGPSHRVPLRGLAVSSADAFATPFGLVPVDDDARRAALGIPGVRVDDAPHALEHSLEVQVPFLQSVLDDFALVPLAVGQADPETVAAVIAALTGGAETLIVVSSDLSHYQSYDVARRQLTSARRRPSWRSIPRGSGTSTRVAPTRCGACCAGHALRAGRCDSWMCATPATRPVTVRGWWAMAASPSTEHPSRTRPGRRRRAAPRHRGRGDRRRPAPAGRRPRRRSPRYPTLCGSTGGSSSH